MEDNKQKKSGFVTLIGRPNVGKSTLISVVSAAKPKIANYHFTTITPVLGVVRVAEEQSFVMADIPGLIEGASDGVGLGHEFLRHVERCRLIIHVVDASGMEGRDPIEDYETIQTELERFSEDLAKRPQLLAANKCDLATPEQIDRLKAYAAEKGIPFFPISAATTQGTAELVQATASRLAELPPILEFQPDPITPEELEQEADTLSHAEEIKAGLFRAGQVMNSDEGGLLSALKECLNTMLGLQKVYPSAGELAERLESSYIELKDISQEVSGKEEEIEFNPVRLEEVNDRLNLIYTLQQKHRVTTVDELLALADDYAAKLANITSSDEQIEELKVRSEALYSKVKKQAAVLTKLRTAAAREVEKQMAARLIPLGMPNVRFRVEIGARKEPGGHGADTVNFLFSANKNGALQSISSVASGGEIARVMLSVKAMIAGAVKLPTIVFDEIDTGVSGEIADRMADIMQEMGDSDRQVISITHLPQIAARGRAHYKVYKQDNETETNSHIRRLTDEERVGEIAHMLSGATLTEAALNNAKALLGIKR